MGCLNAEVTPALAAVQACFALVIKAQDGLLAKVVLPGTLLTVFQWNCYFVPGDRVKEACSW